MDMKKLLESMDHIEECGMTEMPAMTPPAPEMDKGNPVTVNVSMNASGKEHVADLLDMMKNAGLGGAEPVSAKMLSPRMDMERLSDIVDEPGFDDKQEPLPSDEPEESIEEGGMKDQLIQAMEKIAADNSGQLLHKALSKGAMGPDVQNYLQDMYNEVSIDHGLHPDDDHDDIEERMWDEIEQEYGMGENEGYEFGSTPRKSVSYDPKQSMPSIMKYAHQPDVTRALRKAAGFPDDAHVYFDDADLVYGDETVVPRCGVDDNCTFGDAVKALKKFVKEEDYANEPDAQYGDMSDAIPDGNDLNRKKKSYAATQDGDNPMAVENIKAALYAALTEKKKTMVKGPDGKMVPDYAADGKGKGDLGKAKKDTKTTEGRGKVMAGRGRGKVMAGRGRGKDKLMAGRGRGKKK